MIYFGTFKNIIGEDIDVEIITNNDETNETELLLSANPITITSTSDGLFSPIKADSATIRILTELIYPDMYSNTENQSLVTITNASKRITIFRGYLTPNIYSLDYTGLDSLELEAVSALSTLKNRKYYKSKDIVSWYDLISEALNKVGYNAFYFPNSYTTEDNKHLLKYLHLFADNFFDNDDEKTPWTYYSILEEFCKYFCLSLVVHNDEIYFLDYNNLQEYTKFITKGNAAATFLFNDKYTITKDSYKETGAKISYDDTYNKIVVKDNLYEISNVLSNPMEDLVNLNVDKNKFYEQNIDIDGINYTYLNAFFKSEKWTNTQIPNEITVDNLSTLNHSSFWQKEDYYETAEEPSSLNWQTYLTACNKGGVLDVYPFLITRPKEQKDLICNGGYFVINMDYKLSNNIYANDCFKTSDLKYSTDKYSTDINDTMFPCKLYVGNYFYDGDCWVKKSEFERKLAKGYYKSVAVGTFSPTPTWYKYKDADGDWKFTNNKAEWDATTTEKESGKSNNTNKVYYYTDDNALRIFIDEDYYNECTLQDKFYLVHKNKKDDKIFDDLKSLTNTVSWRMNIVDSEDGVAIKLPNFLLNGKLTFELYSPNVLGDYGLYRTDIPVEKALAVHISLFEMLYKVSGDVVDIFEGATVEDDVIYTNVINEEYVNEFDDLEIKVNTLVEDRITSLSSVLFLPDNSDAYTFLNKFWDNIFHTHRILEENILLRYYNHYNTPKLILEASLENKLLPYSLVLETNLNKTFVVDSYELDVEDDNLNVKLIEV